MTTVLERAPKTATPRKQRWRNRYWVDVPFTAGGEHFPEGEHPGQFLWPSKEIAEAKALESLEDWGDHLRYLGAELEGEG